MPGPPSSTASLRTVRTSSEHYQKRHAMRSEGSVTSMISRSVSGSLYWKPIRKQRTGRDIDEFKKEVTIDDHTLEYEDFLDRYQTDMTTGLTQTKADELLAANGPNCLVPSAGVDTWKVFCMHLFGGFNAMIWLGSILTFVEFSIKYKFAGTFEVEILALGVVLGVTALVTGLFGFFHERKHTEIIDSFSKLIPKFATVIRDGNKVSIPSEELVEGDLVELGSGNMVPADMRIMESLNLKVDNSAITGESTALARSPELSDYNPLETQNLVFYGTSVVEGYGVGIVIKCGHDTVLGHIAGLTSAVEKEETLLRKELNVFVKVLSVLAFLIAASLFGVSMGLGYGFFYSFAFFIAIMVANVPEGLPVAFTTCMTLTAKRMAEKNCLVKKFECIETLGACSVICSDKTGTLTQNKMVASHLYYDGIEYDLMNNLESINEDSAAYSALCTVAILCSRATFVDPIEGEGKQISGDASEIAIMRIMDELVGELENIRTECPKVCEIPFTSATKYQLSIHQLPNKRFIMVMKGAPERVLEHCSTILREGETLVVNPTTLKPIKRSIVNLGRKGERVLAFADLFLSDKYHPRYAFNAEKVNFTTTGLRFVGLISLLDPPKPSVPEAVSKCKSAGIRVIMVTGDHPITASAIARKVGIISMHATSVFDEAVKKDVSTSIISFTAKEKPHTAAILTGTDLNNMSEHELRRTMMKYKEIVFARTSPQQKLKIVESLQNLKFVVAATGDGVNDSPALKKADIGIAMGITGSDVSKEAADMILLDDNFASIVTGIEEGRLIFDNLKKSICFELTSNVPEIVPFVFMIALNLPQALSVMAILVIDVGTDLWAAISLSYEKREADIMKKTPRNPKVDKLINRRLIGMSYCQIGVIQTCAAYATYFYLMAEHGWFWNRLIGIRPEWENPNINDLEDSYGQEWTYEARQVLTRKCISGYFISIVITQIADLISCKTRRLSVFKQGMGNHVLNAGLMFEIFLAGIIVFCPGVNDTFNFAPINLESVIPSIPFAIFLFTYDELRKLFIRRFPNGFIAKETYY